VVVLQAGELSNLPFSPDVQSAYFQVRAELLGSVAAQSKQGVRVVVPNATHSIHLVQPQTVIDTIRQVVRAARGGTLSSCERAAENLHNPRSNPAIPPALTRTAGLGDGKGTFAPVEALTAVDP
jgi:hypothetical protein